MARLSVNVLQKLMNRRAHYDVTELRFGFLLSVVVFLEKPLDITAKEGQTVTLSCMTSDPEASVTWYRDEEMIKAGGRYLLYKDRAVHQLRILRVEEGDAGLYTCKTKDADSCATLTVKGKWDCRLVAFVVSLTFWMPKNKKNANGF